MAGNNLLAGFKFFSNVAPESLEMIAQKGEVLELEAGDVVFHFNEPAEQFYGLLEGENVLP